MCRIEDVSKRLIILSRGTVALRPAFLRSCGVVMMMGRRSGSGLGHRGATRRMVIIVLPSKLSQVRGNRYLAPTLGVWPRCARPRGEALRAARVRRGDA